MFHIRGIDNRVFLFISLIVLSILFYPLFWCVYPGILLILCPVRKKINIVEILGFVFTLSIGFWISTSWIIQSAGISIRPFTYAVIVSTLILSVVFHGRIRQAEIENTRDDRIILLLLGIAALLRFVPLFLVEVPPGADMSMHTYLTHLIVRNGSIPSTFEPLLPLELHGSYALGFHYLSALTSLVAGIPVHKACLTVTCLSHALYPLAMYILLRKFSDRWGALAMTIVSSFVCSMPQSLIGPGSNPTALAVDLLVIASAWLLGIKGSISWTRRVVLAVILTAAPLTHAIPSTGYAFVVVPVVLSLMVYTPFREREAARHLYRNGFAILFLVGLMLIPYLLSMEAHLSRGEINWVRNWQNIAFLGASRNLPFGLEEVFGGIFLVPFAIEKKLGSTFLLISALGLINAVVRRKSDSYPFIVYSVMLLLLILNWRYWLLPLSYVLYPDRLVILLTIPLAVLGTSALSWLLSRTGRMTAKVLLTTGLLVVSGWFYAQNYLLPTFRLSAVSDADMRAFRWIENNTDEKAIFLNNYGDAGLWIPAMVLRPAVVIHSNPVYLEEFRELQLSFLPHYVYIGARPIFPKHIHLKSGDLEAMPDVCRKVYDENGAMVFEVLDAPRLRDYFWNLEEIRRRVDFNRRLMGYEDEER
jgi:hypothetical protein